MGTQVLSWVTAPPPQKKQRQKQNQKHHPLKENPTEYIFGTHLVFSVKYVHEFKWIDCAVWLKIIIINRNIIYKVQQMVARVNYDDGSWPLVSEDDLNVYCFNDDNLW